jgi:Transmembrane adaptor Erv26
VNLCSLAAEPETTASGLLWLSELIEEHSKLAKILGKKGIYVCCLSLWFTNPAYAQPLPNTTGHNLDTHFACAHRCSPLSQDCIFHILPRHIPAKFFAFMARHLPYFLIIRRILRPRRRGPFHVVLPFRTPHPRGPSGGAQSISRRARGKGTYFWRHGYVFWAVCVVGPIISFLEPERQ